MLLKKGSASKALEVLGLLSFLLSHCCLAIDKIGLTHSCDSNNCIGDRFFCVDSESTGAVCDIDCHGVYSCQQSTFVVANSGGLQLRCGGPTGAGTGACFWAKIEWIKSENLAFYQTAITGDVEVGGALHSLNCTAEDSCYGIAVNGSTQEQGLDTTTHWKCEGVDSCKTAQATYYGSLALDCVGPNSCVDLSLACLSGANCEMSADPIANALGAVMTCVEGVDSCYCSPGLVCPTITAAPTTQTPTDALTSATTDEPITTSEPEQSSSTPFTTTAEQISSTTGMPATTEGQTETPDTTETADTTETLGTTEMTDTTKTPDSTVTDTTETPDSTETEPLSTTKVKTTELYISTVPVTTESEGGNSGSGNGISNATLVLILVGCGVFLAVGLCLAGIYYLGYTCCRKESGSEKPVPALASVVSVSVEQIEVEMHRFAAGEGHVTGGGDDSEERGELKDALRKVGKMQQDEKDTVFGQMLGDLRLGNALMEEDVVEDMGVVGETLGYGEEDAEFGEGVVHCSGEAAGGSTLGDEPIVGEGAADGGHQTAGFVHSEERRDERDVELGQVLSSLNVGNALMTTSAMKSTACRTREGD